MKILYFTSTGNSLYVAKRISEKFRECELISISRSVKENKFEFNDDIIGIIYPIHYAGVPINVYDFLSQVKINEESYVFTVGVSGGGSAYTSFYQVSELLKRKIDNNLTVKYISNYTRMSTNPTEERAVKVIKKYDNKIDIFTESIKKKEVKQESFKKDIGCIEYKIFRDVFKNKDKKFNVNDNCIRCTMCQKICPVDNIILDNNKPIWTGKCIDCMACINVCPQKAINIGKSTVNKNRYRNPYIKLEELIK